MMGDWTFFSNYGHVLVCLARDNKARLRDVAADVGITERAVQKIVKDLQTEGFITVRKQGRCNRYRINRRKTLRHALESHCTVGKLLVLVAAGRAKPSYAVDAEPGIEEAVASPEMPRSDETIAEPAPEAGMMPAEEQSYTQVAPVSPAQESGKGNGQKPQAATQSRSKRKSKPEDAPLDVEQQGSLF